jgi:peroxiredoxin 2/4
MNEFKIPLIGEQAPEFNAPSTLGNINFPDDYKWKWVVLFSHPADFTPVCTTEFIAFQSKKTEFDKRWTSLVWYSLDWIQSHIAWVNNIKEKFDVEIEFPIVADMSIAFKYGMLQSSASTSHTVRAVFVINPEWKVAAIMYYPLSNGRNIDEILRLIDSLQMTDKHGRATPANWPNNEIFWNKVIVPPAANISQMKENISKYEHKDWYICTEEKPN